MQAPLAASAQAIRERRGGSEGETSDKNQG